MNFDKSKSFLLIDYTDCAFDLLFFMSMSISITSIFKDKFLSLWITEAIALVVNVQEPNDLDPKSVLSFCLTNVSEEPHFQQVLDDTLNNLDHLLALLVNFRSLSLLWKLVLFSLWKFNFWAVCIKANLVFCPLGQVQVGDKSTLLGGCLSGHLTSPHNLWPVIWL